MPGNLCLGTFEITLARSGIFADMDDIQAVPTLPCAFFRTTHRTENFSDGVLRMLRCRPSYPPC